jgi:hypothetical protein
MVGLRCKVARALRARSAWTLLGERVIAAFLASRPAEYATFALGPYSMIPRRRR